ncbi:MAG TPA: chemotaxis protein CheW [Candidatus Methanoperedens sp.]
MATNETISEEELQLVAFNVGSEEFGVKIMNVQEIIRMTNVTRIPQAPDYIRGIINLRGRIIVVLNLNKIMGMECREQDESTRIIVTNIGDNIMGFVVDSVSEVIRLSQKNVEPAPPVIAGRIGTEYVLGVGKLDNRLLILLDLDNVLGAKQLQCIKNLSKENEEAVAS